MSRKNRNQKFEEDDRDLPHSAQERPRGRGRGDRPNRERRKLPQERALVAAPTQAPVHEDTSIVTILSEPRAAPSKRICGLCRNWFDRGVIGGRGECDHPGSGILFPYDDTPACEFFVRR